MSEDKILASTPFLDLVQRGKWYFARRPNSSAVVCVAAETANGLLLVEQYRPAIEANAIELPAGLAGDIEGQRGEAIVDAAKRELLEETGYVADEWEQVIAMPSSAGLTDESITLFMARGLEKVEAGGGDESENITVHEIPMHSVHRWLLEQNAMGKSVDARVFAGIYFLGQSSQ